MEIDWPKSGTYVVAVSGGVDSMALLDLLHQQNPLANRWHLIVAHVDHGIRNVSNLDALLVQNTAEKYNLPYASAKLQLGSDTSEATARQARYEFLRSLQHSRGAEAIITAHHQDDVLETAVINMLRGTNRRGLTALSSHQDLQRPLLKVTKQELIKYANEHNLAWREDATNQNDKYLRNYVRHHLLTKFTPTDRDQLLKQIEKLKIVNTELDKILQAGADGAGINRQWFNSLGHEVSREVLAAWLRAHGVRNYDKKLLDRVVVAAKTAQAGKTIDVMDGVTICILKDNLALRGYER